MASDFYMPFLVGDYLRDTRHLSLGEHGAYILLLSHYWATRKPIGFDSVSIYRITGAFTEEEKRYTDRVLSEFFVRSEDGFINPRMDRLLQAQEARRTTNAANGKRGGRPRKISEKTQTESEKKANGNPEQNRNETQTESEKKACHNHNQIHNQSHDPEPQPQPDRGGGSGCFFKINLRGQQMVEDEWIYRCLVEHRRSKKMSVHGAHNLESLVSLYPSHLDQVNRWLTQPMPVRMAAFAYVHLNATPDEPFRYALKVAEEGRGWVGVHRYMETFKASVIQGDYEVKING